MYRQHQKSAKNVNEQQGMMNMMTKGRQSDGVSISNSFRVNIKVKNFISRNAPPEVDLVISIYEVVDEKTFPKALCEIFRVKGWKTRDVGQDNVQNRKKLKAVFGDIYMVYKAFVVSHNVPYMIKIQSSPPLNSTDMLKKFLSDRYSQ